MNNKNKILSALLVVLILLTGFVMFGALHQCSLSKKNKQEVKEKHFSECFLQKKLRFDDTQMNVYEQALQTFQPKVDSIKKELELLKRESFVELKKEKVDMQHLDSLSNAIGMQHVKMKNAINEFYLTIKNVCNPNQIEELEELFLPLFSRKKHQNRPHKQCN